MSPKKIIRMKKSKSLEERRLELLNAVRRNLYQKIRQEHGRQFESAMDNGDMSVAGMLESVGFRLAGIREGELRKIVSAEKKIQNGTYGICEECGDRIGEKRLSAIPFALYCSDCERRMKGNGGRED